MFDEALFIIAVYCIIHGVYRQLYSDGVRHRGFMPQLSDVEALTIVIVGEYLSLGDDKAIFEYFYKHYRAWFPALSDRTLLARQWANLWQVEQAIWQVLVRRSGADHSAIQIIDTVPVPIRKVKRYKRRHIFCDDLLLEPEVGYCASKDWYYFGFKGSVRIAANGMIVHAPLLMARPVSSVVYRQRSTNLAALPMYQHVLKLAQKATLLHRTCLTCCASLAGDKF